MGPRENRDHRNMGSDRTPVLELGSSGATIPALGFGTAVYPFVASESTKEAILHAIKVGYRHFDTAAVYQTESILGQAIAEALELQLIQSRRDVFVTSKLWCTDAHPHRVLPALRETLMRLGLEYLDLYLIHHPVGLKGEGYEVPFNKQDIVPMDLKSVWEAMEEAQKLGLTKHVGVSNFSIKRINDLLAFANIPPAVNQVEMSPLWHQHKLREFCKSKGIHITAYSPLGAKGTLWGHNYVMDSEVLKEIAKSRGKSVAQICLRWVYEQGVSVLVKSFNKERMKENIEIFDWELYPEDHHKISQIPQQTTYCGPKLVCPSNSGTFESLQEYWH